MDQDTPFIQPNYVLECFKYSRIAGISNQQILADTGWDFEAYERNPVPVSLSQVAPLIDYAYKTLKMPYLGLAIGQQWRLSCHGLAGITAMSQPTYRDALKASVRLSHKAFPAYAIELIDTPTQMAMRITETFSLEPYSRFFMEMTIVSFYNLFHFLLGDQVEPNYISFDFPEPPYKQIYHRYLKCPVKFNSKENAFYLPRALADVELQLANQQTAAAAEQTFNQTIRNIEFNYLPQKLRLLLIQSLGAFPDLETAARRIGMSGRTLRRKLNGLGSNYQKEIDQVRKEYAIKLLRSDNSSITEIALKLGYCDTSAFSRAFKAWTGVSPREYKKNYRESA